MRVGKIATVPEEAQSLKSPLFMVDDQWRRSVQGQPSAALSNLPGSGWSRAVSARMQAWVPIPNRGRIVASDSKRAEIERSA